MKTKVKMLFILIFFNYSLAQAQSPRITNCNIDAINIIMEDIFSPPVASRIHVYSNIAAYEVLCKAPKSPLKSLYGQIKHIPSISNPKDSIHFECAANFAFIKILKKLVFTEYLADSLMLQERKYWTETLNNAQIISTSEAYAEQVKNELMPWIQKDGYIYTRTLERFKLSDSLGAWQPTPPEYHNGLEPNWMYIRKLTYDSLEFEPYTPNYPYSEKKTSPFYKEAMKVYKCFAKDSQKRAETAWYWDCNPATTISSGHLSYVVKKPTPGGHWLKITTQTVHNQKMNYIDATELYAVVSIAMFEGFIQCWASKYLSNSIRPETYIQRVIDKNWNPLIETPPFPEYTSGHSVVSAAISSILTHYIKQPYSFYDSSQMFLDMKPRFFKSFLDASQEASMSRFYGGIHFMPALDVGRKMGFQISKRILNRIKTRKN